MHRRQFLGGVFAVIAASTLYVKRALSFSKIEPSKYAPSKATDEMSDEEWNRIRDEEEKAAGWMPSKQGYFIKDDYDAAFAALYSDDAAALSAQNGRAVKT